MAQKESSIGIDSVSLVSLFVESVLYGTRNWSRRSFLAFSHLTGLFIVLFIASTVILLGKTRRLGNQLNKPLLTASFTMFILATIVSAIFSYTRLLVRVNLILFIACWNGLEKNPRRIHWFFWSRRPWCSTRPSQQHNIFIEKHSICNADASWRCLYCRFCILSRSIGSHKAYFSFTALIWSGLVTSGLFRQFYSALLPV